MKKLLTIAMMAGAMSAMAVESSNTFGILRVDSSAAQTIVAVPWLAAGGDAIKVKDVVKTANLTIGDKLYYYDTTEQTPSYKMWALTGNGWEGATSVMGQNDAVITASAGENQTLARGGAIILVRQNPTTGTPAVANPFYLYGQYTTAGSSTTCVAKGYTLLAPPSTAQTDLNSKTWSNVGSNDYIILSNGKMLTYKNEKWGYDTRTFNTTTHLFEETHNTSVAVIEAGEGAWYVSNSETGASVVWATTPVQQ